MDIIMCMWVGGISAMAEWRISLNIYRPQEIESEMAKKETPFEVSFTIDLENKVNGKIVGNSKPEKKSPRWNRSERLLNEGRRVGDFQ